MHTFAKYRQVILKELLYLLLALLLSAAITYAFAGNYLFTNFSTTWKNLMFGFCHAYFLWKGNHWITQLGSKYLPWDKNPGQTLLVNSLASVVYSIVAILSINILYPRLVFHTNIFDHPKPWIWQMAITFLISMLITLGFYLAYFFKGWRIAVMNEAQLKQETLQLRYDALKSQINPHFLFNSLSVLSALVDIDKAKAKAFIQQFSFIYRYVLEQKDKELVPLEEEMRFVSAYIDLHRLRHGDNLKVTIAVTDLTGLIVPLSLQTILENCFKHNIVSEAHPLNVQVYRDQNKLVVENTLQVRKTTTDSSGIGLETIHKRYKYLTEQPLRIVRTKTHFTVEIPIIPPPETTQAP